MKQPVIVVGIAVASACFGAYAQVYPSKLVKVVVPYPPGGAVDVATRQVAQKLAEQLSQPFVVENKPGATGLIGIQTVTHAPPAGYTLVANDMTYSMLPYVFKALPFDHDRDLVAVSTTMFAPYAIAVKS